MSDAAPNAVAAEAPAVVVEHFGYRFAERSEPTLREVSFTLSRGSFTVVAGPTGGGKSTLLRALAGLIPHHAAGEMVGGVRVAGLNTRAASPAELAAAVGLVLQSPDDQICTTSVEAEIAFGLENLALDVTEIERRIEATLVRFGLRRLRRSAPHQLSGGLRQRLVLAAVAAMQPRVLVCDEPLSQLDPPAAREFLEELDRLCAAGVTVVVAEHRLEEVLPHAERLLVLDEGRLAADVATDDAEKLAAALKLLTDEATPPPPGRSPRAQATESPIVALRQAAFRYPRAEADVWSNVSAEIRRGECIALVGPNGSGKSTLLGVLADLLRPTAGRVDRDGGAARLAAALVPQQVDLTLFSRTVREELAFGPCELGCDAATVAGRVADAASHFHLEAFLDEPPQALSRGQRVRTALAAAYATHPMLLLLDEPTTGQDGPTVRRLMAALRATVGTAAGPGAVLFSTHHLATARRHADRIWLLRDGRLIEFAAGDFDDAQLAGEVRS